MPQVALSHSEPIQTSEQPMALEQPRKAAIVFVDRSKVVQKPISQTQIEDPREFQLQQLRRRFSPKEAAEENGTALAFRIVPSDPDFPFEMEGLECILHVPQTYPKGGVPSLDVRNKEMDRGYQINVERGFDDLVHKSPQSTLLGLLNALDRKLESLLTEQKAKTIKIIPNTNPDRRHLVSGSKPPARPKVEKPTVNDTGSPRPQLAYTAEEKTKAQIRRETECRQIEARLGKLPFFYKSSDGIEYTIPLEPLKKVELPIPLQSIRTVKLFVPLLYPLQPCRLQIQGITGEAAANVERGFGERATEKLEVTLMGHINYLSQNMHVLAKQATKQVQDLTIAKANTNPSSMSELQEAPVKVTDTAPPSGKFELDDRSHLIIIPRPPEWTFGNQGGSDSESSESYDSEDESGNDASDEEPHGVPEPSDNITPAERGILLSFPFLELHNVELLELVSLGLTVKCDRCKDTTDISNLHSRSSSNVSGTRTERCKKCANLLNIGSCSF